MGKLRQFTMTITEKEYELLQTLADKAGVSCECQLRRLLLREAPLSQQLVILREAAVAITEWV